MEEITFNFPPAEGTYFFNDQSRFQGVLKDSKLLFSKDHFRDLQPISNIFFQVSGKKNKWEIIVPGINMQDGDFRGEFRFKVDQSGERISGSMDVPKVQLRPAIYKLMLDSDPFPFKLSGEFQWLKGSMDHWFIDMRTSFFKSNTYKIYGLKAKGRPEPSGASLIEIHVPSGELHQDSKWIHWLEPTLLGRVQTNRSLKFRDFVLRFKLFKDRSLQWKNGSFFLENGWFFSSQGSRDAQKQLKARIQWSLPDDKASLAWFYQGKLFKGTWQAGSVWMDKWLMEHDSFLKKHSNIKILTSSGEK